MENLNRISTETLIDELKSRGYNTSLLISKWDVLMNLNDENEERPDDEKIMLDDETILDIVKNFDTEQLSGTINYEILEKIQNEYCNEKYFVSDDEIYNGNATYVSIWENGSTIETPCKYDVFENEVTDVKVVEVGNEFEVCEEEYIIYDGQIIKDFKMDGMEFVEGMRFP